MNSNENIGVGLTEKEIFQKSLKKTNDSYLLVVIACGALILGGVIFAVISSVFTALLMAIAGVLSYIALTSNILYRLLGLSRKSDNGRLTVTALYGKNKDELFIPSKLIWQRVTGLGDNALNHSSTANVRILHLPSTLISIGENAFLGCDLLSAIVFEGNMEEWTKINVLCDTSIYDIICADGVIPSSIRASESNSADEFSQDTKEEQI